MFKIYTTNCIRCHINQIGRDKPFSIRQFLVFGTRDAVDQAFHRLVESGYIRRVARGVFVKNGSRTPSVREVACTKAKAFGKKIATHGLQSALDLKLVPEHSKPKANEHLFAVSGATSSFRFGDEIIRFKSTWLRKMELADTKVGLTVRALWQIGKSSATTQMARDAIVLFRRTDRELLCQAAALMPAWMRHCFAAVREMNLVKAEGLAITFFAPAL